LAHNARICDIPEPCADSNKAIEQSSFDIQCFVIENDSEWRERHPAAGHERVAGKTAGMVARVFSSRAADLVATAGNAATSADGLSEVAPVILGRIRSVVSGCAIIGLPTTRARIRVPQDARVPLDQPDDQYFRAVS
jgi:hypothetical protein